MNETWNCYSGDGGQCQRELCANYMQLSKIYNSPNFLMSFPNQELGCKYPNDQLLNAQRQAKKYVQREMLVTV